MIVGHAIAEINLATASIVEALVSQPDRSNRNVAAIEIKTRDLFISIIPLLHRVQEPDR